MKRISIFLFAVLCIGMSCTRDDSVEIQDNGDDTYCVNSDTCPDADTINPGNGTLRTFKEAKQQFENLKNNSIGKPLTRNAGFPQSGTMTYKGMHSGEFFERNSTATIKFDYYADVEMTVDFEAKKLSGKILNFSTNLEGFENPEGELTFGGNFRFDLGGDEIGFSMPVKEGSLTQGNRVAKFDAKSENKGRFFGKTGGLMWLRVSSTFKWTEGPDAGTTSATVGHVYSERQ